MARIVDAQVAGGHIKERLGALGTHRLEIAPQAFEGRRDNIPTLFFVVDILSGEEIECRMILPENIVKLRTLCHTYMYILDKNTK